MKPRWQARRRPPWWPDQEAWPPVHRWHDRRRRVMRVVGVGVAMVMLLSVVGAATLISLVIGRGASDLNGPRAAAVFLVLGAFAFLMVFFALMRRVASPLGEILTAADRAGAGDFSGRVREAGPPFLRSVARAFNTMLGRLKAQDEQRRQLMADVAHELRTPLSVMQGRLEGILDGVYTRDDVRIKELLDDTRVLGRLVEDLRTLSNADSGALVLQRESTDMAVLAAGVVQSFRSPAETQGLSIMISTSAALPLIDVDPVRIREVVTNVIANALRHTPSGGSISVSADASDDRLVITVSDTGSGIPAEELPKIFGRFYKGSSSRGSGLGLAIARKLVTAHGGEIAASSQVGKGTTITIEFPVQRV